MQMNRVNEEVAANWWESENYQKSCKTHSEQWGCTSYCTLVTFYTQGANVSCNF